MYGLDEESLIANKGKIGEEQQKKNYENIKALNLDLPFDIDLVDPECHACVLTQLEKYKKFVDDQGVSNAGQFIVPCEGITITKIFNEDMKAGFTEEQWEEVKAQADIVHWAKKYLKLPTKEAWQARWYQEQVLRCTSRRKVLRISRRAGKTDMVCVEICYYLFTQPNIKIVVAGPQKTHTEEIVNRVRSFIQSNSELSDCVVKDISAPYYKIKLTTGAELRGFAAGGRGKGGDGSSIRGQDADRLYLEEMDYIAEDSITGAVLPLLQTKEETYMVGFSTPSGMQTPYYNFCEKTPGCKEFQHSYLVLPHYKAVEADRSNFTEEKWTHEFLAQWGSSDSGVYKPQYIDDATEMYKYTEHKPMPGWKYCIGTDWNEKHGTEIAVIGWDPFRGKFTVVDTEHIEASQFTQLEGVKRLLQFNKKWQPDFIYIDAGNGSTNYELLMKKALNARGKDPVTAKLLKTLKKYDSGAAVETKDPVTHQLVRKPAKSFMVNASVRMFEQGLVVISGEDVTLDKQLRNYIIERYTPTGNPVYGLNEAKVGDHRLDAVNLALVAFHKEFDDLHKTNNICTNVGAAPDPRNMKAQSFRGEVSGGHVAGERRLDTEPKSVAESLAVSPLAAAPAKLDKTFNMKTNRVGWATDEEDKFMAQAMQRKRGRQNFANNRPTRTTF